MVELDQSIYSYSYALYIKNDLITDFMDILTGKVNPKEEDDNDRVENKVLNFLEQRLKNEERGEG